MNSIILTILIVIFISIHSSLLYYDFNHINQIDNSISNDQLLLLKDFTQKLFSNETTIKQCIKSLEKHNPFGVSLFYPSPRSLLGYSGTGKCSLNSSNYSSVLMIYSVSKKLFSKENEYEWNIIEFVHRKNSLFTAFCINKDCQDAISVVNTSSLFNSLLNELGIHNFTIYDINELKSTMTKDIGYKLLCYSLLGVICLMLSASLIRIFYSLKSNTEIILAPVNRIENDREIDNEKEIENERNDFFYTSFEASEKAGDYKIDLKHNEEDIQHKKKSTMMKILSSLSFAENYYYLSEPINEWFNDSSLELVSVLRFVFLFMITYNHTFFALISMTQEDFMNIDLYKSFWFGVIKATIYGIDFSIALNAFVVSYKLMWYLKKNCYDKGKDVSLKVIISFTMLLIPKIIIFLFEYYLFILRSSQIACDLNTTPYRLVYDYLINVGRKDCEKRSWLIFIPFYLQYSGYFTQGDVKNTYSTCFRYCLIYQNELLCCLFFLLLIYIINIIRSRLFDCMIGLVVILGLCLTCVDFMFVDNRNDNTTFDYYYYLGQTFTLKYTHMFIHIYMLGALSGVVYFYHKDSISSRPISFCNKNKYTPFDFCFKLMKIINSLKGITSFIIQILCIIVFIVLSSIYHFYRLWYLHVYKEFNSNQLIIPLNSIMYFFYYYDRSIIVSSFLIYILLKLIKSKQIFLNFLSSFKIMTVVSRVSFSVLLCIDSIVFIFLMWFDFDIILDYFNCFVISIGLFFINALICILLTVCIEVPIRVLVKGALRKIHRDNNINNIIQQMVPLGFNLSL